MNKTKKFLLPFIFSLSIITISLVSSLSSYFVYSSSFYDDFTSNVNALNITLNNENYKNVLKGASIQNRSYLYFDEIENIYYSNFGHTFSNSELLKIKNGTRAIKEATYDGKKGITLLVENGESDYLFCFRPYTDTYYLLLTNAIVIPVLTVILSSIYVVFNFLKEKNQNSFLKYQVRKLRKIANINSMVEYDNDVENLANILRDTRRVLDSQLKNNFLSELKLNFILDSINQGLLVINLDGSIILSNEKGRNILHLEKDDKKITENKITHDILINIKVVSSRDRPLRMNKEIDGKVYQFDINNINESFNENQSIKALSILIVDITEGYNSEKMKRDFFANAAHELKSPLTTILGYQELIKDGVLTSKAELENANEKTIKEGERMNKLIMDMLQLSSLENNNLRPIEKVDVIKELDHILMMLEEQIFVKKIKIIKNYEKLILKINNEDFYNLFKNIIENAIRYNIEGGKIEITINTKEKFISVTDSGIGISDEDKQRIFERFYIVDKARGRKTGGTGLGLSIVKYICNYYDYKIEVKSVIGQGSTFTIYY